MSGLKAIIRYSTSTIMLCCLLVHQTDKAALQWVAWVGMLADYSIEEGSLSKGATKTFSGKSPCGLCAAIEKTEGTSPSEAPGRPPEPTLKDTSSNFLASKPTHLLTLHTSLKPFLISLFDRVQERPKAQFLSPPPTPPPRTMGRAPLELHT